MSHRISYDFPHHVIFYIHLHELQWWQIIVISFSNCWQTANIFMVIPIKHSELNQYCKLPSRNNERLVMEESIGHYHLFYNAQCLLCPVCMVLPCRRSIESVRRCVDHCKHFMAWDIQIECCNLLQDTFPVGISFAISTDAFQDITWHIHYSKRIRNLLEYIQ